MVQALRSRDRICSKPDTSRGCCNFVKRISLHTRLAQRRSFRSWSRLTCVLEVVEISRMLTRSSQHLLQDAMRKLVPRQQAHNCRQQSCLRLSTPRLRSWTSSVRQLPTCRQRVSSRLLRQRKQTESKIILFVFVFQSSNLKQRTLSSQ